MGFAEGQAVLYAPPLCWFLTTSFNRIAGREILKGASASLPAGRRIGLVGRNGAGKTTLLRLILGQAHADDGEMSWPSSWRLGAVAQEAPGTEVSLLDTVLGSGSGATKLLADAEHERDRMCWAKSITGWTRSTPIRHRRGRRNSSGPRVLRRGSTAALLGVFGGWRMRVALAAVLFASPDLLLLDEPTNYLDLEGVMWLENFLQRYRGRC